jgi:DNA-binding NarL/FixJ family response regulator
VLGLAESTDYEATVVTADGRYLPVEVSSVVLRESHQVIGVFGVAIPDEAGEGAPAPHPDLSPRQHEVLLLLANGLSTAQIAEKLSIAPETVRNHIKAVLRALGAHSRLEAVARAHELGIV